MWSFLDDAKTDAPNTASKADETTRVLRKATSALRRPGQSAPLSSPPIKSLYSRKISTVAAPRMSTYRAPTKSSTMHSPELHDAIADISPHIAAPKAADSSPSMDSASKKDADEDDVSGGWVAGERMKARQDARKKKNEQRQAEKTAAAAAAHAAFATIPSKPDPPPGAAPTVSGGFGFGPIGMFHRHRQRALARRANRAAASAPPPASPPAADGDDAVDNEEGGRLSRSSRGRALASILSKLRRSKKNESERWEHSAGKRKREHVSRSRRSHGAGVHGTSSRCERGYSSDEHAPPLRGGLLPGVGLRDVDFCQDMPQDNVYHQKYPGLSDFNNRRFTAPPLGFTPEARRHDVPVSKPTRYDGSSGQGLAAQGGDGRRASNPFRDLSKSDRAHAFDYVGGSMSRRH